MYGQPGAGKSTTINNLFNNDNLCPISSKQSMTERVSEIERILTVSDETFEAYVKASLALIDVPGTFDWDKSKKESNLNAVLAFHADAAEKQQDNDTKYITAEINNLKVKMTTKVIKDVNVFTTNIRKETYPNLVLLCIKSDDNRMCGKDPPF